MILVVAAGGTVLLENPQNSLIALHSRHIWFVNLLMSYGIHVPWLYPLTGTCANCIIEITNHKVAPVSCAEFFKVAFWMRKHMAITWKRTWVWGTSKVIGDLDLGPLHPSERPTVVKTTKRWVGKDGKRRWQGTKSLKTTQLLGRLLGFATVQHEWVAHTPKM